MTDTRPRDRAAGGVVVLALLHRTRTWTCTRPLGERLCIPLAPFASAVYAFWPALEFRHPNHAVRPSTKLFAACLMFVMGAAALSISRKTKLRRDLAVTTAEPTVECRRRRKSGMLGGDGSAAVSLSPEVGLFPQSPSSSRVLAQLRWGSLHVASKPGRSRQPPESGVIFCPVIGE